MKAEINLFNAALEPGRETLPVNLVLWLPLLVLVAGLLATAAMEWRARHAEQELAALGAEVASRDAQVQRMAAEVAARRPDPQLQQELAGVEALLAGRTQVMAALRGGALGDTAGMARYFRALAQAHEDGLWLREVQVSAPHADLVLAGQALDAALLPRYLLRLGRQDAFAGRAFATVEVGSPGRKPAAGATPRRAVQPVDFRIATALPEGQAATGTAPGAPAPGVAPPSPPLPAPGQPAAPAVPATPGRAP